MFCSKCGKQNTDESMFCGYCGAPMLKVPNKPPKTEPAPQIVQEPESKPAPVAQPVAEPMPAQVAQPVVEPMPAPVAQPVAEPVAQPAPSVRPEPIAQPIPAAQPEPVNMVQPEDPFAAPVMEPELQQVQEPPVVPVQSAAVVAEPVEKPAKKKNKALPFIIIGIVLLVLVIAGGAVAFVLFGLKRTINLDDYVVVETSGYDGIGTANVYIDWESMEERYGSNLAFTSKAKKDFGDDLDDMSSIDVLKRYVDVDLERTSGLSNGMEVYYDWDIDEDYSKYLKYNLKFDDDRKYEVTGLEETELFDAFADLSVSFVGAEPYGVVVIEYLGTELSVDDFIIDMPEGGLKNGDVVTITIDPAKVDYLADEYGIAPEVLEMEYTVEGLSDYLTTLSGIGDDALDTAKTEASGVMSAYISENWGSGESLSAMTYVGNIFVTAKDGSGANKLYLIYKIEVRNTFINGDQVYDKVNTYYWYICFENVGIGADGQISINAATAITCSNMYTIESGITVSGTKIVWDYYGYKTFQDLLDDLMLMLGDDFDFENNVDMDLVTEPDITPTPTVTTTPIDTRDLEATYISPVGLTASAYYIQGEGTSSEKHFVPELVLDGDISTAWNVRGHYADEDGDGEVEYYETCGVGEFLDFEFEPGTMIKSITIYPGFIYSLDDSVNRFGKNYAPTVITVTAGSKSFTMDLTEYAYDVELAYYGYTYEFPDWVYLKDGHLRVTIDEVRNICYENHEDWWNDCCISEIEFMGYVPGDDEY